VKFLKKQNRRFSRFIFAYFNNIGKETRLTYTFECWYNFAGKEVYLPLAFLKLDTSNFSRSKLFFSKITGAIFRTVVKNVIKSTDDRGKHTIMKAGTLLLLYNFLGLFSEK